MQNQNPDLLSIVLQINLAHNKPQNVFDAIDARMDFSNASMLQQFMQSDKNTDFLVAYVCSSVDNSRKFFDNAPEEFSNKLINHLLKDLKDQKAKQLSPLEIKRQLINPLFVLAVNMKNPATVDRIIRVVSNYVHSFAPEYDPRQQEIFADIKQKIARIYNALRTEDFSKILRSIIAICGSLMRKKMYVFCDQYLYYDVNAKPQDKNEIVSCLDDAPGFFVEYFSSSTARTAKAVSQASDAALEVLCDKTIGYICGKNLKTQPEYIDEMLNAIIMLRSLIETGKVGLTDGALAQSKVINLRLVILSIMQFGYGLGSAHPEILSELEYIVTVLVIHLDTADVTDQNNRNVLHFISKANSPEFVEFLLNKGANLQQRPAEDDFENLELNWSALCCLLYNKNGKFLPQVKAALTIMPDAKSFVESEMLAIIESFQALPQDLITFNYALEMLPALLSLLLEHCVPYNNLALIVNDKSLWDLDRISARSDTASEKKLLRSMFEAFKDTPIRHVLDAIHLDAGDKVWANCINVLTQSLLLAPQRDHATADSLRIWTYLANNSKACTAIIPKNNAVFFLEEWSRVAMVFMQVLQYAAESDNVLAQWDLVPLISNLVLQNAAESEFSNPFTLAVANQNVEFLLLVTTIFSQSRKIEIANLISKAAVAMINSKEDVAIVQPLVDYLNKHSNSFLCMPSKKYYASILDPIKARIAEVRPSIIDNCIPSRKSSKKPQPSVMS